MSNTGRGRGNEKAGDKVHAFILINTYVASEEEVLYGLRKIEGITRAFSLYGAYDLIAEVEADSMTELKRIIDEGIYKTDKIKSVTVMIAIEGFGR